MYLLTLFSANKLTGHNKNNIIFPLPVHINSTSKTSLSPDTFITLSSEKTTQKTKVRQILNHTMGICSLLHPENIKVQDIRESLVQKHAKNLPCAADPNKDFKRKGPRYAMIHKPTAQNTNVDKHVSFKEDLHQDLSDDASFQPTVEDEEELKEEDSEYEDITST
eukprot:13934359-Ditylum_brightwellii.AAC.1